MIISQKLDLGEDILPISDKDMTVSDQLKANLFKTTADSMVIYLRKCLFSNLPSLFLNMLDCIRYGYIDDRKS